MLLQSMLFRKIHVFSSLRSPSCGWAVLCLLCMEVVEMEAPWDGVDSIERVNAKMAARDCPLSSCPPSLSHLHLTFLCQISSTINSSTSWSGCCILPSAVLGGPMELPTQSHVLVFTRTWSLFLYACHLVYIITDGTFCPCIYFTPCPQYGKTQNCLSPTAT